jgi:hypothetical protein
MTMVKEVADLLELVANGVKDVRSILEAARDGHAYLKRHHPEAQQDLAGLLEELRKLVQLWPSLVHCDPLRLHRNWQRSRSRATQF